MSSASRSVASKDFAASCANVTAVSAGGSRAGRPHFGQPHCTTARPRTAAVRRRTVTPPLDLLQHVRRHGRDHFGVDIAGRDGVDGDPLRSALLGEGFGKTVNARLGGRIVHLAAVPGEARERRERDDPPAPVRADHRHDERVEHVEEAVEVRAQDPVPGLAGERRKRGVGPNARVQDDPVVGPVGGQVLRQGAGWASRSGRRSAGGRAPDRRTPSAVSAPGLVARQCRRRRNRRRQRERVAARCRRSRREEDRRGPRRRGPARTTSLKRARSRSDSMRRPRRR